LDILDIRILREFIQDAGTYPLQSDIRKSFRTAARKLHVAESTVRARVKILNATEFLKGWDVFPNPGLFGLRVAHCRCDVVSQPLKKDAMRKIRLIQGVWTIVNHFGNSIRVSLYYEDEQSLKKQIELIARISRSENTIYRETHFPNCDVRLTERDWEIVRSIQRSPMKSYDTISKETGLSNKTVKRRLQRMVRGRALFTIPSINPRGLSGAMLGELLVIYDSPEAKRNVNRRIGTHVDDYVLSAQLGDPEHTLFLILITNISQVNEILNWVKQQPGVKSAFLDLVEERVEQYEAFNHQLERKMIQVQSAGRERLQPANVWAMTFRGNGDDVARSVAASASGGYTIAGYTTSFGAGGADAWIVGIDAGGGPAWQETIGGAGNDYADSIQPTSDGGYVVAGSTDSSGAGSFDMWVAKLTSNGAISWQKTIGGAGNDHATSGIQTTDGGYLVVGNTSSFGSGGADAWVVKLDSAGIVIWQKAYGGGGQDTAESVQQTSDGGYIVAGSTSSFGVGGHDIWLLRLDSSGNIVWQNTYGGSGTDRASSVKVTSDGGYVVAGYTNSFGAGQYDFWVLKLDSSGRIQWQRTYGATGSEFASSVVQLSDGRYLVAGSTTSAGNMDGWVLHLNTKGDPTAESTYGGAGRDGFLSAQLTSDGGLIAVGFAGSFGNGAYDFFILKLNNIGFCPISCRVDTNIGVNPTATNATGMTSDAISTSTTARAANSSLLLKPSAGTRRILGEAIA
jgi:uncharacterized delta-60 repeat protein